MTSVFIFFYAIGMIVYYSILSTLLGKTIFLKDRGHLTLFFIFFFMILAPSVYSVFMVGSTTVLFNSLTGRIPLVKFVPFFYVLAGIMVVTEPLGHFHKSKKLIKVAGAISFLILSAGVGVLFIDPWWNDRLEQALGIPMPSVGLFLILCHSTHLLSICVYEIYRKIRNKKVVEGEGNA